MTEASGPPLLRSLNGDGKLGLALLAALAALLLPLLGGDALRLAWRYQRDAIAAGEWWRFVTAHFVHLDAGHALLNSAGLVLLWALFARALRPAAWSLVLLLSIAAIGAGFWWWQPQLKWYVGASGLLHGAFAAGALAQARRGDRIAGVALLVLVGKLAWERWQGPLPLENPDLVITAAHRYGALGGVLAAILARPLLTLGSACKRFLPFLARDRSRSE